MKCRSGVSSPLYNIQTELANRFEHRWGRNKSVLMLNCPVHGGDGFKLYVYADGGVWCHSQGCPPKKIKEALGVWVERRDDRDPDAARCPSTEGCNSYTSNLVALYDGPDGKRVCVHREDCYEGHTWNGKECAPDTGKHNWGYGSPVGCFPLEWGDGEKGGVRVVVEGEKAAAALRDMEIGGYTPVSWRGGSANVLKADWSEFERMQIILWPDADEAGKAAMGSLAVRLLAQDCIVSVVDTTGLPSKSDAADFPKGHAIDLLANAEEVSESSFAAVVAASESIKGIGKGKHAQEVARRLMLIHGERLLIVKNREQQRDVLVLDESTGIWRRDENLFASWVRDAIHDWVREYAEGCVKADIDNVSAAVAKHERGLLRFYESRGQQEVRLQVPTVYININTHRGSVNEVEACRSITLCDEVDLDGDGDVIGTPDGVLHLPSGRLMPPSEGRGHMVTKRTAVGYVPGAWKDNAALRKIVSHYTEEQRERLFETLGYAMYGNPSARMGFLVGEGGGGKTTFLEMLRPPLGEYSYDMHPSMFSVKSNSASAIDVVGVDGGGTRIATMDELDISEAWRLEAVFNNTTGRKTGTGRRPYDRYMREWKLSPTIFSAAQKLPRFNFSDYAIRRRVFLVEVPSIPESERDSNLGEKLEREENQKAILSMLVEYAAKMHGVLPEKVGGTDEYLRQLHSDAHGGAPEWIAATFEHTGRDGDVLHTTDVWSAAVAHMRDTEGDEDSPFGMSKQKLTIYFREQMNLGPAKSMRNSSGKLGRGWRGVSERSIEHAQALLEGLPDPQVDPTRTRTCPSCKLELPATAFDDGEFACVECAYAQEG